MGMDNEHQSNSGFKMKVQRFGSFLSGMIMPNIGAFIAWGIITALFIPTGWIPNAAVDRIIPNKVNEDKTAWRVHSKNNGAVCKSIYI